MLDKLSDRIAKSADEARASVAGQNVRAVLMASLVGAILILIIIAAFSYR